MWINVQVNQRSTMKWKSGVMSTKYINSGRPDFILKSFVMNGWDLKSYKPISTSIIYG